MKTVLVACGAAVATSTVVAKKIEKIASENGVELKTVQAKHRRWLRRLPRLSPTLLYVPVSSRATLIFQL